MRRPARKKLQTPFAKNLKAVLAERGLSQKAAAEIAGITPATLNDWLADAQPADLLSVQRLARGLSCDFEWLLTGTQNKVDLQRISMSELFDI